MPSTCPHVAFNRHIGEFAQVHTDTAGKLLFNDEWEPARDATLPNEDDAAFVVSLMQPEAGPASSPAGSRRPRSASTTSRASSNTSRCTSNPMDAAALAERQKQHLIDPEICIRCNTCEATCPVGAITHDSNNYVVDAAICNFCMDCVSPCPTGSIDNWFNVGLPYSLEDQYSWLELPAAPLEPTSHQRRCGGRAGPGGGRIAR